MPKHMVDVLLYEDGGYDSTETSSSGQQATEHQRQREIGNFVGEHIYRDIVHTQTHAYGVIYL